MAQRKTTSIPVAGLTGLAVAAVAYIVVREGPYLETRPTQRPAVEHDSPSLLQVDARLWQDPFSAIDEFEFRKFSAASGVDRD